MSIESPSLITITDERLRIWALLGHCDSDLPSQPGVIPVRPAVPDEDERPEPLSPRPLWVPRVPPPGERSPWERPPERRIGF